MSKRRAVIIPPHLTALVQAPMGADEKDPEFGRFKWSLAQRLIVYMWRHRGVQLWVLFYAVLLAGVNSALPVVITETIRWTIESPQKLKDTFNITPFQGLGIGAGIVALLAIAFYFVMSIRLIAINRLAELVVFDIRHDLFAHVQSLDMSFFDRTKLGRILSRGTGDISAVRNAVVHVIPRTVLHTLMMVFLFAVMFRYDVVLAFILLGAVPVVYLANTFFDRRLTTVYRTVQESFSRLTSNIAETVSGIRVTQAFAREDINAALFEGLCQDHRRNNMRAAHVHGLYIPMFELCFAVATVLIIVVGAWRLEQGHMSTADLIGFLLCIGGFFMSIIIIADLYNITLQAMAGAERIFALLDTRPQITDQAEAEPLSRTSNGARIEFRNVTFGYTAERSVLHDVSFTAEPGRTIALVGHTGSGKTSIVSLICRLYAHQSGDILIDGRPIQNITLASLHSQTGLVLQDNFLFTGSVMDNIRFARPDATDDQVRAACLALDCLEVFESLPEGLLTDVGERGTGISLGQRQLVTFARAMLADPRILMLDEATSAVDTFTEYRIQLALEKLMQGRTCIVVAHRLSTVRRADQILVLDHGRIIERGTHDQLLAADARYATLYNEFIRLTGEG